MVTYNPKSLDDINRLFLSDQSAEEEKNIPENGDKPDTDKSVRTGLQGIENRPAPGEQEPAITIQHTDPAGIRAAVLSQDRNNKDTRPKKPKKRRLGIVLSIIAYSLVALSALLISLVSWLQNTDMSVAGYSFYTLSEYGDAFEYEKGDLLITKSVTAENIMETVSLGSQIVFKKQSGSRTCQIVAEIEETTENAAEKTFITVGKEGNFKNEIPVSDNRIKGAVICRVSHLGAVTGLLEGYTVLFLILLSSLMIACILLQVIIANYKKQKTVYSQTT